MGTDIHAYLEIEKTNVDYYRGEESKFHDLFCEISFTRDYLLFDLLAGVRGQISDAVFEPRGFPSKASFQVVNEYSYRVVHHSDPQKDEMPFEEASSKVSRGWCHWVGTSHQRISNPDWHTPSYLYVDELRKVKDVYKEKKLQEFEAVAKFLFAMSKEVNVKELLSAEDDYMFELDAVIAMMETLEKNKTVKCRLVFWFDN